MKYLSQKWRAVISYYSSSARRQMGGRVGGPEGTETHLRRRVGQITETTARPQPMSHHARDPNSSQHARRYPYVKDAGEPRY